MDTCHAFKRPPADIALNTILTLAIIFAYIPQYRRIIARNSSQGLSTYYVLLHGLVSTQQFSSALLVYATPSNVFTCIKASGIRGFDIIGALLGLLQSFVQWSCALVLLVLVTRSSPTSSLNLIWVFAIYSVFSLLPALFILVDPRAAEMVGPLAFFVGCSVILLAPLSTALAISQAIPELLTLRRLGSPQALSIVSLGSQIFIFILLAVSWDARLRPSAMKRAPATATGWYQFGGWIIANYGITAVVDLIILLAAISASQDLSMGTFGIEGERTPLLR